MSRYDYGINLGMFQGTGFEVITVTTGAAIGLSTTVYTSKTMRALMTVENGSFRYRYDKVNPTTTIGHVVNSGDIIGINGYPNMSQFKMIAISGTATVMVTYENEIR